MTNAKTRTKTRAPVTKAKTSVGKAATTKAMPRARAKAPAIPTPEPLLEAPKLKAKLVRDSFTIPKSEYVVLEALKLRAAKLERPTKKSELLRAGVAALDAMSDKAFLAALARVPSLKTGRPKGDV